MTPAQQSALEGVAGRALTAPEVAAIDPLLSADNRKDVAIASVLSTGRTRLTSRMIGERGIMAALGTVEGEACLKAFETFAATPLVEPHPLAKHHPGIKRMLGWLKTDAGLDIGTPQASVLLGTMAQLGVLQAVWVSAILALAQTPNPIATNSVSNALNIAEGRMTL